MFALYCLFACLFDLIVKILYIDVILYIDDILRLYFFMLLHILTLYSFYFL